MRLIRIRNIHPRRAIVLLTFLVGLTVTIYVCRTSIGAPQDYEVYYNQALEHYNAAKEHVYKNLQYYSGSDKESDAINDDESNNITGNDDTGVSTRVPEYDREKLNEFKSKFEEAEMPEIEDLTDDPSSDQKTEESKVEHKVDDAHHSVLANASSTENITTSATKVSVSNEINLDVEEPNNDRVDEIIDDHDTNNLIKSEKIKTENKKKEEEIDIENEKKKKESPKTPKSEQRANTKLKEEAESTKALAESKDIEEPKDDKLDEILDDYDTNSLEKIEKINNENSKKIKEIEAQGEKSTDSGAQNITDAPSSSSTAEEISNSLFKRLQYPLYKDIKVDEKASKAKFEENIKIYKNALKKPISEPKLDNLVRQGDPLAGRANATILALVQNDDLDKIVSTIQQFEEKYNFKFGYPYTFMNDEPFSDEFKDKIKSILPSNRIINFAHIKPEEWNMPDSIDKQKYTETMKELSKESIQHVEEESYHNMCRFYSKGFYHQDILKQYKYTWRIEPDVNFYCNIDYDIFQFMDMNDKIYGFTISLYDSPQTVKSLWNKTMEFVKENPQFLNENGSIEWLKENLQKPTNFEMSGYSTCHFWTNFEITNLDFLRSEPYEKYVNFLESTGGFYYERWGDAPVRSIALGLFADKSKIHWFRDVAYQHFPYTNCPTSEPGSTRCDGKCKPGHFTPYSNLNVENCLPTWIKYSMTEEQLNMY